MMFPRAAYTSRAAFRSNAHGKPAGAVLLESYPGEYRGDGDYPICGPSSDRRIWYCRIVITGGIVADTYVPGLPHWWPW